MKQPLSVIFLWHMHQPYYKDPLRGEYILPWTYLHGIKDYYDMAAIVDEVAGARAVFNLVPSLLEQLEEYAAGQAIDPFLSRGRMHPADMGEDDRLFILENFFAANRQRLIEPVRRYFELFCLSGGDGGERARDRLRLFRDQDILDLQVCFFLAWTGEAARRRHPALQELVRKGSGYTAADKELLFATHRQILGEIIPLYKRLHAEGKLELSVTPYFHPILPLLCDLRNAQTAMPKVTLPTLPFRFPQDARSQVATAVDYFTRLFGFAPAGMWPSEGSVCDEVLEIIADCGLTWVATDEGVLLHTLPEGLGHGREALYQSYRFQRGAADLALFFRDHALSDLIGFTYSQWGGERAVGDFRERLLAIGRKTRGVRVVPVILDGENAWEYYEDNGYPFLMRLYQALADDRDLRLTTCSDFLAEHTTHRSLDRIYPGSWINADYGIWIGHPEENLAWDYLCKARDAAVRSHPRVAELLAAGTIADFQNEPDGTAALICRSLFAAEGSDWFWWYGDDHFSPHSDRFDLLFRRHLMNVYRLLGLPVPSELYEPIKKKSPAGFVREPAALISPVVNGLVTDYFEWLAAGLFDLSKQASAMHSAESMLQSFFYGFDRHAFYFRIDGQQSLEKMLQTTDILTLHLISEREYRLVMGLTGEEGLLQVREGAVWHDSETRCRWKILKICEAKVPLDILHPEPGGYIFAFLTLTRGDDEVGRWPTDAPMRLRYVGPELELETWLI